MNIPLVHEINIPSFIKMEHDGFLEVNFKPIYNPGILVCHMQESNPQDLPIACQGIHILFNTSENLVFVGTGGTEKEIHDEEAKANLCANQYSRLYNLIYKHDDDPDKNPKWQKAILIFDWENDIKLDKSKKKLFRNLNTRIDNEINKIMREEISDLKKILLSKINSLQNWHLENNPSDVPSDLKNLTGEPEGENAPFLDSERCNYYVTIIMQLIGEIENETIEFP